MSPFSYTGTDSDTTTNSLRNFGFAFLISGLVICCSFWTAYWFPLLPGLGALFLGMVQANQTRAQAALFGGATGGAFFKRLVVMEIVEGISSLIGAFTAILWMIFGGLPSIIDFIVCVLCLSSCLASAFCAFASYQRCKYLTGEGGATLL